MITLSIRPTENSVFGRARQEPSNVQWALGSGGGVQCASVPYSSPSLGSREFGMGAHFFIQKIGGNVKKQVLNLTVDPGHVRRLDELARQYGCNRSEVARMVFDNIQVIQKPALGAVIGQGDQRITVAGADGRLRVG